MIIIKNSKDIVEENKTTYIPNAGIKALAQRAWDDPDGFCIMDDDRCWVSSYRESCLDRSSCHEPDYMLACVATRNPDYIGEPAIKIYNEAMQ